MTGVPHAIASIITRPKGSGQLIGKSNAAAPARPLLCRVVDFPAQPHLLPINLRLHLIFEIASASMRTGNSQRHASRPCNPNCGVQTFIGAQPPKKSKIASALQDGTKGFGRKPMVHRSLPIGISQ